MNTFYRVKENEWASKSFVCIRETVAESQIGNFIEDGCSKIWNALLMRGLCADGIPFAFIYSTDKVKKVADVAAAIMCSDAELILPEFEVVKLEGKVVSTTHTGYFEDISGAYNAINNFMINKKLEQGFYIEEYLGNPQKDLNLQNWKTNIHCMVLSN